MSLTVKEILDEKTDLEIELTKMLRAFTAKAEIKVDYLRWKTEKYDEKKKKYVKIKPVIKIDVNIDNDPRSLD